MPIIKITEQDLTKPGEATESTDVVYVPGFVNLDQDCLYEDADTSADKFVRGNYIGIAINTPTLFKDVESFETLCGKRPYIFTKDQLYSDLPKSFAENATPSNDILIARGTADPGYVLAKELLSAGLQVLFERVNANGTADGYSDVEWEIFDKLPANEKFIATPASKCRVALDSFMIPYSERGTSEYVSDAVFQRTVDGGVTTYTRVATPGPGDDHTVAWVATSPILYIGASSETLTSGCEPVYFVTDVNGNRCLVSVGDWEGAVANNSGYFKFTQTVDFNTLGVADITITVSEDDVVYGEMNCDDYVYFSFDQLKSVRPNFKNTENLKLSRVGGRVWDVCEMYNFFSSDNAYNPDDSTGIVDRGNYSVKYLTSGGYPTYEYDTGSVVAKMLNFAEKRGDCVALIDHTDNEERGLDTMAQDSLFASLQENKDSFGNGDFGAMFTPWCTYNRVSSDAKYTVKENNKDTEKSSPTSFRAPASYAYLAALADSIKTNANWLAIAGAARGSVLNLANGGVTRKIPNAVADKMQPRKESISINPITEIRPYGQTIWGNRTLKMNEQDLVATSFLNIRNLISDVKKTCYRVARSLTFEQDTDVLWINFKSQISALLNRMQSGYGISGYKILRDTSRVEATTKATLCAKVILYPTYAVEDFYIDIILKDDEVIVE